jgi:hypothetical protein
MAKRPTAEMIAEGLSVPERVLVVLHCKRDGLAEAGVKSVTVQQMMIRGLIDRGVAGSYVLTDQGRAVLEGFTMRAATRR